MVIRTLEDFKKEELRHVKKSQKFLKNSELGLWLYGYDDIFSDFDPRPYSHRALSEDFLKESKEITKDKTEGRVHLRFFVPEKSRNMEKERMIKGRLHEHFRKHESILREHKNKEFRKGLYVAIGGIIMMFVSAVLKTWPITLFHNILVIIFEPSGWFLAWFGFDNLIDIVKEHKPELSFYEKMSRAEISFAPY